MFSAAAVYAAVIVVDSVLISLIDGVSDLKAYARIEPLLADTNSEDTAGDQESASSSSFDIRAVSNRRIWAIFAGRNPRLGTKND